MNSLHPKSKYFLRLATACDKFSEEKSRSYSGRSYSTCLKCKCDVNSKRIEEALKTSDLSRARKEISPCKQVFLYKTDWESYGQSSISIPCVALDSAKKTFAYSLASQKNIKDLEDECILESDNISLSVAAMKKDEVTLAGEGGQIVGEASLWESSLRGRFPPSHKPLQITSIGGGIGYDAVAIGRVFGGMGYHINTPIVVDPNPFTAYFSQEIGVDYFLTTGENYFFKNFKRDFSFNYLFHIGTVLGVLPEEEGSRLLKLIAANMRPNDIFSLLFIDEEQFKKPRDLGKLERIESFNEAGLVHYISQDKKDFYKTVIGNSAKFVLFMENLGLKGDIIPTTTDRGLPVTFLVFHSIKEQSEI